MIHIGICEKPKRNGEISINKDGLCWDINVMMMTDGPKYLTFSTLLT